MERFGKPIWPTNLPIILPSARSFDLPKSSSCVGGNASPSCSRNLPEGDPIPDYHFEEGPRDLNAGDAPLRSLRLSELFTKPDRSVVIYHFMFGKRQTKACPMCTSWLDGANGVAHHLAQNLDSAVVAAADLPTLRAHARERGWDMLCLLSR